MSHSLLCKLRICLVCVGYKRHAPGIKHADALNLSPFCKMPCHDLLDIVRHMDPANVHCAILAGEAADATHVVAVVAKLVAAKAVNVRVEDVVSAGQSVEVVAILALGAANCQQPFLKKERAWRGWEPDVPYSPGEKKTEIGPRPCIGARVPGVLGDIASPLGMCLRQILVFPIAT